MYIATETTPNPNALSFRPDLSGNSSLPKKLIDQPLQFSKAQRMDQVQSPLADELFRLDGVQQVFLGQDFITINKLPEVSWAALKPQVIAVIMDFLINDRSLIIKTPANNETNFPKKPILYQPEDALLVAKIEELIDTRIRPAVARDGGDIILEGFDKGVVYLHMRGACAGCPSSTATLKAGIENILKHFVPEVKEVRQSL